MGSTTLEQQITDYRHWREQLAAAISDYRDWLDLTGAGDAMQDLRLYDMAESVKKDRLVLAFVAEFARGKTETINALFFSDFKSRLLPCDAGRTTMCPTEIFWDGNEEPYIKLLPIETRKRDDGLTALKMEPSQWVRLRLDTGSADAMKEALRVLVEQKEVSVDEARELGLWNDQDITMQHALKTRGKVDVPVWRHALINYPHPLLKSGLVILDTPGLNTLGTEPELTIKIIPNAHAVIFLLATDTGVTKSDMEIWTRFIRDRTSRKMAVLNKIDILWDDLKSEAAIDAMIQTQVESTAHQLNMPASDVFAISAQKALVARVKNDATLLNRSGIIRLEQALAQGVVATKHEILCNTIVSETGNMVKASRKTMQQRLTTTRERQEELNSLRGKNHEEVNVLLSNVATDRKLYEESVRTFNEGSQRIMQTGEAMMHKLSLSQLDRMLENSQQKIGDSWTTRGLNQGMKSLIRETIDLAEQISRQSLELSDEGESLYRLFHTKHGFEQRKPPALDLTDFHHGMMELQELADAFCADPVNVMTEKHFLIRKFFYTLIGQARAQFEKARQDANQWLKGLLAPLKLQVSEHKAHLDQRTEALMKIHANLETLQKNIDELQQQRTLLQNQSTSLDQLLLKLMKSVKKAEKPVPLTPPPTSAGGPALDMTPLQI